MLCVFVKLVGLFIHGSPISTEGRTSGRGTTKYEVSEKCKVTIDGNDAKLENLQAGDQLELSGQPATSIKATRPAVVADVHGTRRGGPGSHSTPPAPMK